MPEKATELTVILGLVADMTVINPFDYPFVLNLPVIEKLAFVHDVVGVVRAASLAA